MTLYDTYFYPRRQTSLILVYPQYYKALEREQQRLLEKYTQSETANERLQYSAQQLEEVSVLQMQRYMSTALLTS